MVSAIFFIFNFVIFLYNYKFESKFEIKTTLKDTF